MENDFKSKIDNGETVYGVRTGTFSPIHIEILGDLDLDFVWLDMEHSGPSPYDSVSIQNLTRAADLSNIELIVRIPTGSKPMVRKILDAGVNTLLIPHVDTPADIRPALKSAKFSYDSGPGARSPSSSRSNKWSGATNYVNEVNNTVTVGAMIESKEAVENIGDIFSVPDLGFAFVGPSDLSVSMDKAINPNHSDVVEMFSTIEQASTEYEIPLGRVANEPSSVTQSVNKGYQIFRIGGDIEALRQVIGDRLDKIKEK